ncbi:(2Fe-2S)-binding protein [Embleya sp. NBC_00896]|uniref:(2Fe-2S)-binding protein n=1 Tax=Embleya sp. NBC_00896 TaxID=2975961 RepID=UPI002F918254|nr:(2Fe-2S)-binding protein [Embleya sp. NBC_00896]
MNPRLARLVRADPDPAFDLTLDGRPIRALPGQTLAAALWSEDVVAWRRTRVQDEARGAFCGIGVCFDCLVTVNGVPDLRACLVRARPGDEVTTRAV